MVGPPFVADVTGHATRRLGKKSALRTWLRTRSELDRRRAARVVRGEEVARREPAELAELRRHVRLVVVAGLERDVGERARAGVEQRERAAIAHDARIDLRRDADLLAKRVREP